MDKNLLENKTVIASMAVLLGAIWYSYGLIDKRSDPNHLVYAAKFEELNKNGNSACSGDFKDSISSMTDNDRIRGPCCSPMNLHRYSEQVEGLKKFSNIKE